MGAMAQRLRGRAPGTLPRQAPKHDVRLLAPHASVSQESVADPEGKGEGDVYIVDRKPLSEGIKKRTILVFVADESGIINRVSGVFARRGQNIESLAVGLTIDKALFTIVINSTDTAVSNLVKQIAKLTKVRYVEDATAQQRVERELMLIKVQAKTFANRAEVLQHAEVFRAKVVDVSESAITLSASGDPGKTFALQQLLGKFGILEVARTGKIALQRGERTIQGDSWANLGRDARVEKPLGNNSTEAVADDGAGDVYTQDEDIGPGIWRVGYMQEENEWDDDEEAVVRHTMSLLVADEPGVLQQVTSVFARRGYNLQSLAVGFAETRGSSRISLVIPGTPSSVENLRSQLLKLVHVQEVHDLTNEPFVSRELMLIKVKCGPKERQELMAISEIFRCKVCDISKSTVTIEIQGKWAKMAAFQEMLGDYCILEVARTGRIALRRESRVDTKFLEQLETKSL